MCISISLSGTCIKRMNKKNDSTSQHGVARELILSWRQTAWKVRQRKREHPSQATITYGPYVGIVWLCGHLMGHGNTMWVIYGKPMYGVALWVSCGVFVVSPVSRTAIFNPRDCYMPTPVTPYKISMWIFGEKLCIF